MPQFQDYTAASALSDDDLLLVLDSPGGTPATKKITVANARTSLGGSSPAGHALLVTGLVENDQAGAATNTAIIQQALVDAHEYGSFRTALTGPGSEGGSQIVQLPAGRYYFNKGIASASVYDDACITQYNATIIRGQGKGTQLILAAGQSTTADPVSMIKPMENTNWCGVEDLTLIGNRENQVDTSGASRGVDWTRGGTAEFYDGGFWCRGVLSFGWGGAAFYAGGNANTGRFYDCYGYHSAQGFHLKTDQALWGCKAGNNDGEGFLITNSTSCLLSGCKGFGNNTDLFASYSENLIVDNFTSEDYKGAAGIWLLAVRASRVTGGIYRCMSDDANNSALIVEDDGALDDNPWWSLNPHSLDIQLACRFFNDQTGIPLYYPIYLLTTRNLGAGVKINMRASGYSEPLGDFFPTCWTTARWNHKGGFRDCDVRFNNSNEGWVSVPYAASVTPDPDRGKTQVIGALTGNVTIVTPTEPVHGQQMTLVFTQDATGGRTITLPSAWFFNWTPTTTANHKNTITVAYDGSSWVQTHATTGLT